MTTRTCSLTNISKAVDHIFELQSGRIGIYYTSLFFSLFSKYDAEIKSLIIPLSSREFLKKLSEEFSS